MQKAKDAAKRLNDYYESLGTEDESKFENYDPADDARTVAEYFEGE